MQQKQKRVAFFCYLPPEIKELISRSAAAAGMSQSDWLAEQLKKKGKSNGSK